jgi:hypothetical protein
MARARVSPLVGALLVCVAVVFNPPVTAAERGAPHVGTQRDEGAAGMSLPSTQPEPPLEPADPVLVLPPLWEPTEQEPMPPVGEPLANAIIPDPFVGCWTGQPDGYDRVFRFSPNAHLGEPGRIIFCYSQRTLDATTDIVIPPARRVIEQLLVLGLGHHTFRAESIHTDIHFVSPTTMRGRTTLNVMPTFRVFHLFPVSLDNQPTKLDWSAVLVGPNAINVSAYQVLWAFGGPAFGAAWHAHFERIPNH